MIHAFGCSFTNYLWPSWADIINQVEPCTNYGRSGVGNKAIFTRVMAAVIQDRIQPGDRVIVQWSGHTRYDLWLSPKKWLQRGNVWNQEGKGHEPHQITNDFLSNLWSDQDALLQSLSLCMALNEVLRARAVDYKFMWMNDWRNFRQETGTRTVNTVDTVQALQDHWLELDEVPQVRPAWLLWLTQQRQQQPSLKWRMKPRLAPAEDLHAEPREALQYLSTNLGSWLNWSNDQWLQAQTITDQCQRDLVAYNLLNDLHPTAVESVGEYPGWPIYTRDHINYRIDQQLI
jgi:hypothetical protein